MLIREAPLAHFIDHYFGYGSWDAKMWFVGYEEGGGDLPEEVAEKLDYFYDNHRSANEATLCDIRSVYRHVTFRSDGPKAGAYANRYDYRFGDQAIQHGVWKNLIAFVHGYQQESLPDLLDYQKQGFALGGNKREALIHLYPLPSPHNHAWYYSWLDMPAFPFLKSRAQYERHVFEHRFKSILDQVVNYRPDVVLMYGMSNIASLKESVQKTFPEVQFKMVKAVKLHIPQHHRADLNGSTLIITTQIPALRHNRIETGFNWQAFGNAVRKPAQIV
ncbi:MAG TPA: hypothetical protein VGD40_06065 [Chryseosolibacter sp.]